MCTFYYYYSVINTKVVVSEIIEDRVNYRYDSLSFQVVSVWDVPYCRTLRIRNRPNVFKLIRRPKSYLACTQA
jgi:hypothetical protein